MSISLESYSQNLPDIPFISAIFYMVTNGFEHPSGRCYMSCIEYLKLIMESKLYNSKSDK